MQAKQDHKPQFYIIPKLKTAVYLAAAGVAGRLGRVEAAAGVEEARLGQGVGGAGGGGEGRPGGREGGQAAGQGGHVGVGVPGV